MKSPIDSGKIIPINCDCCMTPEINESVTVPFGRIVVIKREPTPKFNKIQLLLPKLSKITSLICPLLPTTNNCKVSSKQATNTHKMKDNFNFLNTFIKKWKGVILLQITPFSCILVKYF